MQSLVINRRARHEYAFLEYMEAGLVLTGQEVKSVRLKRANLHEAFVKVVGNEAFLLNANIQQYDFTPGKPYDPTRSRKLLLHRRQIDTLKELLQTKGMAAIPLSLGISHHFVKVEFGIGKGKKQYQKKEELKRRDEKRDMERVMRGKR